MESSPEFTLAGERTSGHSRAVDPLRTERLLLRVLMENGAVEVGCRFKRFLIPDLQIIHRRQHVRQRL